VRRELRGRVGVERGQPAAVEHHVALGPPGTLALLDREAGGGPRGQPAVEQPDVLDARPAQQPPRPGGGEPRAVVEDHDRPPLAQAPAARGRLQVGDVRQRVPPVGGLTVAGELVLEVDEHGAGDVARAERGPSVGHRERPAHVEHVDGGGGLVELRTQRRDVDEVAGTGVPRGRDRHGCPSRGWQGARRGTGCPGVGRERAAPGDGRAGRSGSAVTATAARGVGRARRCRRHDVDARGGAHDASNNGS